MTEHRYWIGVASTDHVDAAVEKSVFGFGPGHHADADRPAKGDWIAYYSPTTGGDDGEPVRRITAVARLEDEASQEGDADGDAPTWTRKAHYYHHDTADIYDLLPRFSFIKDQAHWGVHFHRSLLEVTKDDMAAIAHATGVKHKLD